MRLFLQEGSHIRRLHGNAFSSHLILARPWLTLGCDSPQVHAAALLLETTHTPLFSVSHSFLSVSFRLPRASFSLLKTHTYIYKYIYNFYIYTHSIYIYLHTQERSCTPLPFPSNVMQLCFLWDTKVATCGRMTDCLVERTEEPFCVPSPRRIPFKIFIHKLLEPFTPHQTLDPQEEHWADASR